MTGALRDDRSVKSPDSGRRPIALASNVLAFIDDGHASLDEYLGAERRMNEMASHPKGLGCLIVVPAGAKPPPELHRNAIEGVLTRIGSRVRGLAWIIEGRGFEAAAVRGVIITLSHYGRRAYPTNVTTSVEDALAWLVTKLGGSHTTDIGAAADHLARVRAVSRA